VKRPLTEERDHETRTLSETDALFVKDLEERANAPLKMNPVREYWRCGSRRTARSKTIKCGKESIL
jgi:hypothetical protein